MEMDSDSPDSTHHADPDSLKDAREHIADSIKQERQRIADSTKTARAHVMDSAKVARQHLTDSVQKVRKRYTDSTTAVRKYRESKHYQDSVAKARSKKATALKDARQAHSDSLKDARKLATDKLTAARKQKTDSVKAIQTRRSDSIAAIRKYKNSKRFADSVSIVKHNRTDSIAKAQKTFRDKMASIRKHSLDSAKKYRQHISDSIKTVRTHYLDSMKVVRKAKTDSLAKVKKQKEEMAKAKEKKKQILQNQKLELKMKQKHEAWSNKQMLKKRWSPMRQVLQNSFTHYNYYYNANKKMDEALLNMQRSRKENYDSLIGLYPYDPNRDSSSMSSDMDTIVRKISVGIQIHDPRVKWENDLYLLLGQAYYYRGKYEYAATSFRYIIARDEEEKKKEAAQNGSYGSHSKEAPSIVEDDKTSRLEFLKHKSVHNDAILWLAHTYTSAHQVENAQAILSLLDGDAKLPDDMRGRLAEQKAFAYLNDDNPQEASKQLAVMEDNDDLPGWLKMRAAFLNGQLQQGRGEYKQSAASFEKVLSYYPKLEMDFYARKYIAFNELYSGENVSDAMRPLKKVLNDGKYVNYYDQVYFVLGQLAVKGNDNAQAITYYSKSAAVPKASRKQKALSFAALGDVYYTQSDYKHAKSAYDSLAKYSSAAAKDPTVIAALQKGKGLEEISGPSRVIFEQDSLMDLAALSHKEQVSEVKRYLRYLEKQMQDSITNAQNAGTTVAAAAASDDNSTTAASDWYFSNTTLMQQGSSDFKRKFGNRPLTDNWRRSAAIPSGSSSGSDDLADAGPENSGNGLPTEEFLLSRIPNTPQQKELSAKMESRAYMLLAKAYMKQLEDYPMADKTLDTLDLRFPNHNLKEEELYVGYQIAMRQNKLDLAKKYSDELVAKYPESQYASSVRPHVKESGDDNMIGGQPVAVYFDETYKLLLQHQYTEALMRINNAKHKYNDPVYKKRFDIAEAVGYAGSGDFNQADSIINKFMKTYPNDTLTPWALSVKQHVKDVRNGGLPSWTKEADEVLAQQKIKSVVPDVMKRNTASASSTASTAGTSGGVMLPPPPSAYIYIADTAHYCIVVLPGVDSRTYGLKQAIRDLNTSKYASFNIDMLLDLYNINQGVLVIRKFPNAKDAKAYMGDLLASDAFHGFAPGEIKVQVISAVNYTKMYSDKNADTYTSFFDANYKQ